MMTTDCVIVARVALRVERELSEDGVEIWTLFRDVRRMLPGASGEQVLAVIHNALEALVAEGVRFGEIDDWTGVFRLWDGPLTSERIMSAVRLLGREPNIGDVGWLVRDVYP